MVVAEIEGSATRVALMVTVPAALSPGVNTPESEIVPSFGVITCQVTAVLSVPVTAAENWQEPGNSTWSGLGSTIVSVIG